MMSGKRMEVSQLNHPAKADFAEEIQAMESHFASVELKEQEY